MATEAVLLTQRCTRIVVSILVCAAVAGRACAASLEEDVQRYIAVFNGDPAQHPRQIESMNWLGLSDERLYDVIEQRLLKEDPIQRDEARQQRRGGFDQSGDQRLALYIRALGFSGQPKYLPTINGFLSRPDYARAAIQAGKDSPLFRRWNPIISERASFDPKLSDDSNRTANMLRSSDLELRRVGAKRVLHQHLHDEPLLEMLAADVKANYASTDPLTVDTTGWMVKALASTRRAKYRPLLEEVLAGAPSSALKRHTKEAIEFHYRGVS